MSKYTFIGRKAQLDKFKALVTHPPARPWAIEGGSGLGKTTLLRQFQHNCIEWRQPYGFLDIENLPNNTPSGLAFLINLADHCEHMPRYVKAVAQVNDVLQANDLPQQEKNAVKQSLAEQGDSSEPVSNHAVVHLIDRALNTISSQYKQKFNKKQYTAEQAIQRDPEAFLVQQLCELGKQNGWVLLVDTFEHLHVHVDLKNAKISSQLDLNTFKHSRAKQEPRTYALSLWLNRLVEHLAAHKVLVVLAGRDFRRQYACDSLPRFQREDIQQAINQQPELAPLWAEHSEQLYQILDRLSFGGIPLWLRVGVNLLSQLMQDGESLDTLTNQPKYLQQCFETPDQDLSHPEQIHHASCKLSILHYVTRSHPKITEEAWRLALPRRLNRDILKILFEQQHHDLLNTYQSVGLLNLPRGTQTFQLHEEIYDLLRFYAQDKGLWHSKTSRKLHQKLAEYCQQQKQPVWLLDASYHQIMRLKGLDEAEKFWSLLLQSYSLNPQQKWQIAQELKTYKPKKRQSLLQQFQDDQNWLTETFSPTVQTAITTALAEGQDYFKFIDDPNFWQLLVNSDDTAWNGLGTALYKNKQLPKAIKAYQQQVKVKPEHKWACYSLGIALEKNGQLPEAIAAFQQQVKVKPDHEWAWYSLGIALEKNGQLPEAIKAYQQQVKVKPDHEGAWNNLGIALWKQEKLSEAETAFAQGLTHHPQHLSLLANDMELALTQQDQTRGSQRLTTAKPLLKPNQQEYVILPFLAWLLNPDADFRSVLEAIKTVDKTVKYTWDSSDTQVVIARLPAEQQKLALAFVAYIESLKTGS